MRPLKLFISMMLIAFLAACSSPGPAPTASQEEIENALDAIRTEAALTVAAEIGNGITASPSPELPTLAPTGTTPPTQTPLPTYTPYPTYTPFVLPTAIPRNTNRDRNRETQRPGHHPGCGEKYRCERSGG